MPAATTTTTKAVHKQLVVFDFDWSLVDQDSDRWVFEVLATDIRRKLRTLADTVQWTDLMAESLEEAHARGITRDQIENALRIIPFHPAMIRCVTHLKLQAALQSTPATTLLCLSNANSVFIETILESKGILPLFDEIITNPACWTSEGLLEVRRRIDPNGPQHKCQIGCSPNLCKGEELTDFLSRHHGFDRIIYIGDGSNDFCPVVRLRSQDMVLCRKYRGLEKRIAQDGQAEGLCCQVKYWTGAWEVEEIFASLS